MEVVVRVRVCSGGWRGVFGGFEIGDVLGGGKWEEVGRKSGCGGGVLIPLIFRSFFYFFGNRSSSCICVFCFESVFLNG